MPRRVERLSGVRVTAVALGFAHMLMADEDGGTWACGRRAGLGFYSMDTWQLDPVYEPTLIPTLRVRVRELPLE